MATTADRKINLVPPKLQRLRKVRVSLSAALDDAMGRQREIREKLRNAQHNLAGLRAMPDSTYIGKKEKTQLQREIEAADVAVDKFQELKEDIESEIAELTADYQPLCGTVRSLEKHLGLHEDEHLFEGDRVMGDGDNFQIRPPSPGEKGWNPEDFYEANKGGKS